MQPAVEAALYPELKRAARNAFQALKRDHPGERFYAYGLYTESLGSYLLPTGNSEAALRRRSGGCSKSPLRWSPCDWEYHLAGEREFFSEVERLLDENTRPGDFNGEQAETQASALFDTAVRVLRELDEEGLFGTDEERSGLVLGLWMGDQSDADRLFWAQQLNPEPVWTRFSLELPFCRQWPPEDGVRLELIGDDY